MSISNNKKIWIHFTIMITLMIGIGFLPPFGQVTDMGMKILGVFIGTLYGWLTIDFIIASMLGLMFLGLSGYTTIIGALCAGFSDSTVVMMTMSFFLVAFLNYVDLTGALAGWFLTRKFSEGKPWAIIAIIFIAAFLIGAINSFASMLLLWSVMYKVADKVGYQKRSLAMAYILCGIVFFAGNGGYLFPFHGGSIMFSGTVKETTGIISNFQWYFAVVWSHIAFLIFYLVLGKFVLRIDTAPLRRKDVFDELKGIKWTMQQKWGLYANIFVFVFLTIPDFLPAGALKTTWSNFGIAGATIIVLAAGYLISVEGKRLLPNPAQACKDGMMWDIFFMIAATMPIGAALRSDEAGIIATIVPAIMNTIGDMHWIVFTIICAIVLGLLTQVSHNLIIAMVIFPTFAAICYQMGGDPTLWFFVNFWAIMAAYVTPAGSGYSAVLHGNSEWLSQKQAYGLGFSTLVVSWLGSFLLLIPIWLLIF